MTKKMKFKPEITRVKLNPEQAVLICTCYDAGRAAVDADAANNLCEARSYAAGMCMQAIKASRS